MFLKGIYAGKPAVFQLIVLLLLILAGAVFSSLIAMGIFYFIYGFHAEITQDPDMMRLLQLFSAIGTFLFPALALAWLCSNNPKEYLSIGEMPKGHILLLTFFSVFLLSPAISLTPCGKDDLSEAEGKRGYLSHRSILCHRQSQCGRRIYT